MREVTGRRAPVLACANRTRLAFLTSTHVVDDLAALGQDFLPNRIGMASGVTLRLAVPAGSAAAPLFGLLADTYGLWAALGTIAVCPEAACVLTFGLPDPRSRPALPPRRCWPGPRARA